MFNRVQNGLASTAIQSQHSDGTFHFFGRHHFELCIFFQRSKNIARLCKFLTLFHCIGCLRSAQTFWILLFSICSRFSDAYKTQRKSLMAVISHDIVSKSLLDQFTIVFRTQLYRIKPYLSRIRSFGRKNHANPAYCSSQYLVPNDYDPNTDCELWRLLF